MIGSNPSDFQKGDDQPVECVSWDDVKVFMKQLNAMDPGKNYRLPAEAEWEYTCRAGTTGERNGHLDSIVWYDDNSGGRTHTVKTKQPNAWGLCDMLRNMREWCAGWYAGNYYASSPATDPQGSSSGSDRVFRGSSVGLLAENCHAANRYNLFTRLRDYNFGFRLARSLP